MTRDVVGAQFVFESEGNRCRDLLLYGLRCGGTTIGQVALLRIGGHDGKVRSS